MDDYLAPSEQPIENDIKSWVCSDGHGVCFVGFHPLGRNPGRCYPDKPASPHHAFAGDLQLAFGDETNANLTIGEAFDRLGGVKLVIHHVARRLRLEHQFDLDRLCLLRMEGERGGNHQHRSRPALPRRKEPERMGGDAMQTPPADEITIANVRTQFATLVIEPD